MKKLLFLGCNFDQIPYMKIAREKGYYIIGTDLNQKAPGVSYVDKYYQVSYEDVLSLIDIGNDEDFSSSDNVFTASSQFAYIGASNFARYFNIPFISPDVVDLCLDKNKFYPYFTKYGLDVPDWIALENVYQNGVFKELHEKWSSLYLKSDYGKSPNYCYKIRDCMIPDIPKEYDRYYRKFFVAQKEIMGNHFRIDWIDNDLFSFFKISDRSAIPMCFIDITGEIYTKMTNLIDSLGLQNHLIKFDVIYTNNNCYFIDIGLEPPMRLRLYLQYLGYDFERLYFEHIVEGKLSYPK